MLLWAILFCLFSANLVDPQFAPPQLLADHDLKTSLQLLEDNLQGRDSSGDLHLIHGLLVGRNASPLKDDFQKRDSSDLHLIRGLLGTRDASTEILAGYNLSTALRQPEDGLWNRSSSEDLHTIRGLLKARQQCPTGSDQCISSAAQCCPAGSSCCGTGCCDSGSTCVTVNGQTGCCPNGQDCGTPQCATAGHVVCAGQNFCCPPNYTCSRDSAGNPLCKAPPPQCQNSNYVVCNGETFCCPPGYICYRDSAAQPQCRPPNPQCADPGYSVCSGDNFCCPSGYACYRDSAGQPKCMSPSPKCATSDYVVCSGESFCCPYGYSCYRDASGNPRCATQTTTIQPTLGNTDIASQATSLGTPPPSSAAPTHPAPIGLIVGSAVGGLSVAVILIIALYYCMRKRSRGRRAYHLEKPNQANLVLDVDEYRAGGFSPTVATQDPPFVRPTRPGPRPQSANSAGSSNRPSTIISQGPSFSSFNASGPQFGNPPGSSNWQPMATTQGPWFSGSDRPSSQSANSDASSSRPLNPSSPFRLSGVSSHPSQYHQSDSTTQSRTGKPPLLVLRLEDDVPQPAMPQPAMPQPVMPQPARYEDSGVRFSVVQEEEPGTSQLPQEPPPTYTEN